MIIDAHAHIFNLVNGRNRFGDIRSAHFGKIWSGNELVSSLQPYFLESNFPEKLLLEMMDKEGIDKAVLLQNPTYGIVNAEIAEAIKNHPDRFVGTIQFDPVMDNMMETIKRFVSDQQNILKFEMSYDWGWTGIYPDLKLNDDHLMPVWEFANSNFLKVVIDTGPVGGSGYQIDIIDQSAKDYPNIKFIIEHMGYLMKNDLQNELSKEKWRQCIKLAQNDNVFVGISAAGNLLEEDFPCEVSQQHLNEVVELIGSSKILWGTDVPTTLNLYTYRQMKDWVNKTEFLSQYDKERILGLNAFDLFF